jgi:hypothetical protein
LQVAGGKLRVASCGLQVAGCKLRVASCGLQVAGGKLRVASCGLQVAGGKLQVAEDSWRWDKIFFFGMRELATALYRFNRSHEVCINKLMHSKKERK